MLSQTVEYALRAFIYITRQAPRSVRVAEVAKATKAPGRYLAKVLSQLAAHGYVSSMRGPAGGYRLVPGREQASFADIAALFDHGGPRGCLLGLGVCGRTPDCPVHGRWAPVAESMAAFFVTTTVAGLVSGDATASPSNSL